MIENEIWTTLSTWVNYPLFTIAENAVTVRSIFSGVLFFVVGIIVSRSLARTAQRKILSKFHLSRSIETTFQTITFYILVISFSLFALRVANIPLTALTVIGGALALGLGFGSQTIVNNFISGLILMVERPIKVGDYVEVQGEIGIVDHIGIRSARIISPDNTHFILPNSSFLEKPVRNWTLENQVVRTGIKVGVQYGAPVEKVRTLLFQVASTHQRVLKDPHPLVMFDDFGDNALQFELLVWVSVRNVNDRRSICSEMRFLITKLFTEEKIIIAYPQRDVHLDTLAPLKVEVLATPQNKTTPDKHPTLKSKPPINV